MGRLDLFRTHRFSESVWVDGRKGGRARQMSESNSIEGESIYPPQHIGTMNEVSVDEVVKNMHCILDANLEGFA